MTAMGLTRQNAYLIIDIRYHVGAVHTVPCQFDQWIVRRFGTNWILDSQLPFNTTNLLPDLEPGMTQVGSTGPGTGPLHLNGSVVTAMAPLQLNNSPTTTRPPASDAGAGALIYDTTLAAPVYSDGSSWNPVGGGGSGGTVPTVVTGETPSGTKDGTNAVFTLAHSCRTGTTAVYRNGLRIRLSTHYSETTATTLTFSTAPLSADDLCVDYVVQ